MIVGHIDMKKPYITIFTPTYNRADLLSRLYSSLRSQSVKDFEWLVVDDGSTDSTKLLVEAWVKSEDSFNIKYIYQDNGGKHRAINNGLGVASGRMFFIVDSDDILSRDAVSKIIDSAKELPDDPSFAGIAKQKGYMNGAPVGSTFNEKYIDATSLERKKHNINGDKAEVFFTDIISRYRFPEFDGEKFMDEAYLWNKIAMDGYKLRWDNDIVYLCEYLEGGLTKSRNTRYSGSPRGYELYVRQLLMQATTLLDKIRLSSMYARDVYNYSDNRRAASDLGVHVAYVLIGRILRLIVD